MQDKKVAEQGEKLFVLLEVPMRRRRALPNLGQAWWWLPATNSLPDTVVVRTAQAQHL